MSILEEEMDSNSNRGSTGAVSSSGSTGAGMHHSHSTPAGVDGGARTPPATPKKGGKMLAIRVQMLDDTISVFQVQVKAMGQVLFDQVCKQLHLLEADYFGLEYSDIGGTKYWLDLQKPISRQLGLSLVDPLLYFCVKFYTPDPGQLEEEYTRYLFCLQIKRDLAQGLMQCNENTASLMASYIVQAECGDYVAEDYPDHTYLSSYKFVPQQDQEMERKIMENHKKHAGQSPAEADFNLLETARRCELYGMKMHPAKDHENVPLNLAVAHMGILVFQNYTKINTFSWAKIRKISFKRKRFLIKLHPEGYGYYKDTVEFFFEGRDECKNFWKKCVENHGFFRCSSVKHVSRHKTRVLSRGSSFRYSGKTQKEIVEFVRDNYVKRQAFQRSASFRHSSAHSSASNMHSSTVGNSISAHPLLPLADNNLSVEVSKLSTSLGSMGASVGQEPASPTTTKSASRHRVTATSWSSAPDTRPITQPVQTTTSPSPPLTTQSASPATSATTSPLHQQPPVTSSPVAVRAAVHRADIQGTTIITTTRTHTTGRMPSSHKSEGSLDQPPPFINHYPLQTQSQNDLINQNKPTQTNEYTYKTPKRQIWQRSASCRDLYDFSFEDSGQAKRRIKPKTSNKITNTDSRKLESPITRYDDRPIYTTSRDNSLEIHQDIMMPDQKVYSSSYPGTTTYSQESMEDPGNYELRDSQDDLSHDSYELIEKSDDDYSGEYTKKVKPLLNTRSCSLDSGNYLPSDTDSDPDKRHKCKSSSDVSHDIFLMDDPRDLPREIIPRKSDGNFYKAFKSSSRTSSLESKSDYYEPKSKKYDSRTSSLESKSEYYDANSEPKYYHHHHHHEYDRKISFERNYGTQFSKKETSHVHSISLQNVKTEQNIRVNRYEQNTIPRMQKSGEVKPTYFWLESVPNVPTEETEGNWSSKQTQSTESESNIFSFDEDKIQFLQEHEPKRKQTFRDVFMEIEPRKGRENLALHQPIERTKSDPNSLSRQRMNSNSRRMLLMHQKSIDLTPAESSDEDYLYKQIPSAPPITKYKGIHFEMPSAEFGHFDILKREIEGQKTKFEVPKSQFEVFGVKTQSDFINLPPKSDDILYVLHKRHIMNGTAIKDENVEIKKEPLAKKLSEELKTKSSKTAELPEQFLFTQNIDLSKVDPVTLEVDKSEKPVQHLSSPKRDITHIDPVLLEALSNKLSQIESDSPNSSKTDSLNRQKPKIIEAPKPEPPPIIKKEPEPKPKQIKTNKPKRVIKPRMQPSKKGGKTTTKTKVRITSFSSDDESINSDDVFGSAEATPTRMEFSPPQMRKEMESILKFESERKYLQYTMSSTEIEGSPPTTRKKTADKKQLDNGLDPNLTQTELRRISERSISIPSSEDDLNIKTSELQPVFIEPPTEILTTVQENEDNLDEEREKEKALLQAEIEKDIQDLKVPPKTKITEIKTIRKQGQSPLLFAHARLNLSEGSAFSLLQKQQATESPIVGRRAKSLDTPIIPVSRLPPLNAFSSKDDTVEEEQIHIDILESETTDEKPSTAQEKPPLVEEKVPVETKVAENEKPKKGDDQKPVGKEKSVERDQIVPDVTSKNRKAAKPPVQKIKPKPTTVQTKKDSNKDKVPPKPKMRVITKTVTRVENGEIVKPPPKPSSLNLPENKDVKEITRTKSQENEATKKVPPKEKAKSLEKIELKRGGSRERTKSQDDSDTDIAKRKEKQQMLYEIAIKQTKTLKSPVKDVLPVFPQVEEMVRERHGKLEISINTIENTNISLEEAIIITKSPKKLDKKMDKNMTKSLELNLAPDEKDGEGKLVARLGKSLDLDNRPKDEDSGTEFDFKLEAINKIKVRDIEEASPECDQIKEVVKADVHKEDTKAEEPADENIILEGTTLDVWLSVDSETKSNLDNIKLIQKSDDFFDAGSYTKPPDLSKVDTKSSSDSQSIEKMSLGNSLDIKYIDDSGDSSHKSEQDVQLVAELQKASNTVGKLLRRKLEKRRLASLAKEEKSNEMVRITSEEESLTEVSELKGEVDNNLLTVNGNKDLFYKLSMDRSRSEDTGSWMTVECDEFVGTESSFDYDQAPIETPENDEGRSPIVGEKKDLLTTKYGRLDLLKRSSDQSRSSDTTGSWTSGEKDVSPSNVKETDDSSLSCTMGRTVGFSQTIEKFASKEQIGDEAPRSPRSPRICILGRAFTIDEESAPIKEDASSSDEAHDIPKDLTPIQEDSNGAVKYKKKPYPFEEKWSTESELGQKLQQKITKKLSGDKSISVDDSSSKRGKPSLFSVEKLSSDSKNSIDTESSSGSLGQASRMQKSGDIPKDLTSTWKPFPLDSSGSESIDDGLLPPDQEYFLRRDNSGDFTPMGDVCYKAEDTTPTKDDTELPEDLANFPTNFGYPCITSNIGDIGLTDMLTYHGPGGFLSRTLSRISERSTNSEKSSVEDDSTKASTQSDSLNDESLASSNPQVSLSSDPPSHEKKTPTNELQPPTTFSPPSLEQPNFQNFLLQRQISDDRRTSAEMAELSMDDIEIITSERGLRLKRQGSDDTIIDEECFEPEKEDKKGSSSLESDEWPLPEIPQQGKKELLALHEMLSSDTSQQTTQVFQPPKTNIPKVFGLRGSLKSQDSEPWPSPPSSVAELLVVGNVETYYMTPEEACKVTVDSTVSTYDNDSNSDYDNRTDLEQDKTHTYENVATELISESISESLSTGAGIKIVLDDNKSPSNSDDSNLNDDVFTDAVDTSSKLRPPTVMRRSTNSDDSSHSAKQQPPPRSHPSSYSDEDCTSSVGTNMEDGTVRFAFKPTKCTHSSHSEDTSIALSLSEWSNSTTTVKFQNLSSSNTTKSSSGLKSDDNSLTDIAQSISEWSSSNSNTMKNQSTSLQFQKLSSTTSTGDSTLTDLLPTISDWSSSDSKTLVQHFSNLETVTRLGSSIDDNDDKKTLQSPKNIPSEDLARLSTIPIVENPKMYTKSTERPMIIPIIQSDTEKSSSSEQKTVHTQRYDKEKKGYLQKTKSNDRPVKVPLKLSKCSPYYSSSLSSESTPLASTSPVPLSKTATVPLTRGHRKPLKNLFQAAKSPPSENDSTSSVESPKSKSERDRRGYRRRKTQTQRRQQKDKGHQEFYLDQEVLVLNEYLRSKGYEDDLYNEALEEGYIPDVDSQSGSDIFRMEKDEDDRYEIAEGFDVASIPPPLLEDDFEEEHSPQI